MPINTLSATLSSGTASSNAFRCARGDVDYDIDVTGLTGTVTIQKSPDGTNWVDVGNSFSADSDGFVTTAGGYLRFTSSISGGSAVCQFWQDPLVES